MPRNLMLLIIVASVLVVPGSFVNAQVQVYGLWHCYSDACSWASVPVMTTFDTNNHWIIDRGDGHPSVNVVVLSFVNPLKLMNLTTDSTDINGIPITTLQHTTRLGVHWPRHQATASAGGTMGCNTRITNICSPNLPVVSVARTVKSKTAAIVGTSLTSPVDDSVIPDGRVPPTSENETEPVPIGPPFAAIARGCKCTGRLALRWTKDCNL